MENYQSNYQAPIEERPGMEQNPYGQDFASYRTQYVEKEEYIKKYAPESFRNTILVCAVISYVLIGINVFSLIVNPLAVFDFAIMLGCTLGVHIGKSKGCAIALLVYGLISCAIGLISFGVPLGWAWVVIPIIYLVQFNKVEKQYNAIYGA